MTAFLGRCVNVDEEREALLKKHNFILVRTKRHKVYRNPTGRIFVVSGSPSDWRASRNSLRDLRRLVGEEGR